MTSNNGILVTGGSGLLGSELRQQLQDADFPPRSAFDVTDVVGMREHLCKKAFHTLVHAAALTSPPRVDREPMQALKANVLGTANVVLLCMEHGLRLVYISTDYVFSGATGNYSEEDAVYPVNKYAWSKLGGECAVRLHDNSLIIRTSFGPNSFPYAKAFVDQWTSRESVKTIASKIARLVTSDVKGTVHVGGPRRTVFEYAMSLGGENPVGRMSVRDVSFSVPVDTSLNISRYKNLINE